MRGRKAFLVALGVRIAALRRDRRLTQQGLADKAGMTAKYLSEIERGAVNASIASLRGVAIGLALPLPRLIAEPGQVEGEIAALLERSSLPDRRRALAVMRALVAADR